jgi:hypothetical protein
MGTTNHNRSLLLTTTVLAVLLALFSCKRDDVKKMSTVQLEIAHEVAGEDLIMDTIRYENQAGNPYSVTRLEYYLANFTFLSNEGEEEVIEDIWYVNPRQPVTLSIDAQELPEGSYQTLQFHIGLPAEENVSYNLPATTENVNMAWPENMGGGYHFMKLEGHFIDSQTKEKGYAMHLGMNQWLVTVTLNKAVQLAGDDNRLRLTMDVNQWFENPHTYDFNVQGNYTMGVDSLMGKLSDNGFSSFTLEQID